MTHTQKSIPWYFMPVWAVWKLVEWIVLFAGRLVSVVLGSALMLAGIILSITVIGAIIGIPLAILGFLLILRGLF